MTWGLWGVGVRTAADRDYWTPDRPGAPENGYIFHDLHALDGIYDQPEHYFFNDMALGADEIVRQMHDAHHNPDHPVTVYRVVPHGTDTIHTGDWVTPSRAYAREFGDGEGTILSTQVPARHLSLGGDSLYEFGYHGPHVRVPGPNTTHRTAMPAPLPKNTTFHYHPTQETVPGHIPLSQFNVPGVEARVNGNTVGWLCWTDGSSEDGGRPVGEINDVYVSAPRRHHGIATALFDFARQHEPQVHHSDTLSDAGRKWRDYEQSRHAHRTAMPDDGDDYDELYHFTDDPHFSGPHSDHEPATISEFAEPGIYLTNDPHNSSVSGGSRPYMAIFRVPSWYEDHPGFEPDHYGNSSDYFVRPEWFHELKFQGVTPTSDNSRHAHRTAMPYDFTAPAGEMQMPVERNEHGHIRVYRGIVVPRSSLRSLTDFHDNFGSHWSTNEQISQALADPAVYGTADPSVYGTDEDDVGLLMSGWYDPAHGTHPDPDPITGGQGYNDHEQEITMSPGTPVHVDRARWKHPDWNYDRWEDLKWSPRPVTASRTAMPMMYHHTSPENAEAIRRERKFRPNSEYDEFTYFSDKPDGNGSGWGEARVDVNVPDYDFEYDFEEDPYQHDGGHSPPAGETFWRARSKDIKPEWIAHRTAMPAIDAYDDEPEFDDHYNPIPGTEKFPEEIRRDDHEIPDGPFYHATEHEFSPGDIVQSHSALHGHQGDRGNHADWVWMGRDPSVALSHAGPHLYEVEPLDEGPWEWNYDIFSSPGGKAGRYVSPRARVVRKVEHNDPRWSNYKKARIMTAAVTAARDLDGIEFGLTPGEHGGSTPQPHDRHMETAAVDTASGRQVGWLSRRPTGEIYEVSVHPDYRRRGIATALFDWTKANVDPELHHSTDMTDEGAAWAATMGWTPDHYNEKQMPAVFHPIEQMPIHEGPTYRHAHRTAMPMSEIPQFGHQLPHVGPLPGADPEEGHVDSYWVSGGCGTLALAFKNMFPDLKIGAEITRKRGSYYEDDDDSDDNKEFAHVWVHDGTHAHDGFGTHTNAPDAWAGSHGGEIDLDVDPQKVADKFGLDWSPDDGKWADPQINEAAEVIEKHWFNRHYNPETGDYQDHPYKEARIMSAAVTVYTQPNCVQCTMTKKQLDKLGIAHDTVDVSADPEAHAYVTGLGYTAAPVVVVNNGESHWAGFRPERLKELVGGE